MPYYLSYTAVSNCKQLLLWQTPHQKNQNHVRLQFVSSQTAFIWWFREENISTVISA